MRSATDLPAASPPVSPAVPEEPSPATGLAQGVHVRALRTPNAVALVDGGLRLDYAALDAAGAAVADGLRRSGVGPGQAVAVALPRSWQLVCAMLGVLRLGAQVVPLDTQSPPDRARHILTDSGSVALIHGGTAPDDLPDAVRPLPVAELLAVEIPAAELPAAGSGEGIHPGPPASAAPVSFLFYTSGTTGTPKGVEVREAGICRLALPGYLRLEEGARYACLSNPAFDALSFEVWVPLLTGGCCVILGDEAVQTPHRLAAALLRERIDTLFLTVALFNAVVDTVPDCFAGVGQVLVGGEQLNARLIRRWYEHNGASGTRLHNVYGPTESTTFALCHPIPRDFDGDVVPIGRVLPGTGAVLVVPGADRTARPGEVAELLLSGDGLAAGYRNLPEETGRRFVLLPWYDGGRERHYRTGDLVRSDADGLVEYVGRADRQVKVRGFRIEPGELERQITAHPAIRQAYVCTRRDGEHGPYELLAYLVLGDELSFEEFGRHLAARLPAYMRPHHIHLVEALPLNGNGKVDQAALLRRDDRPWRPEGGHDGPGPTAWQREVLDLAEDVLGVPELRLGDHWIAVGGDSLKALRLRFEVRRRWGCELPQHLVLRADLAAVAEAVAEARAAAVTAPGNGTDGNGKDGDGTDGSGTDRSAGASPYPVPAAPSGARTAPATSEQQRLWLLQQRSPQSRAYHVGLAFRLDGAVDADALRGALRGLVEQHPALRTGFEPAPEGLLQTVGDPYDPWAGPGPGAVRDEAGVRDFADRFFALPFDLAQPRMLRACWLPQEGGGVLLLRLHHIAVDGWSLNVLFHDLSTGYARALDGAEGAEGADGPVGPDSAQVRTPLDFAAWQAEWFTRPGYRARREELRAHYAALDEAGEADETGEAGGTGDGDEPLRPTRAGSRREGRLLHTSLDVVRRTTVDRLCAELGLTRFQLLLGVFAWSLYGVTGRTRPRVAGPVANRPVQEFESGVGMFANTVLLPLRVAPQEDLRGQLLRLGAGTRDVLDRQEVVLADVLSDRAASGGEAPFDFLFVLENTDFDALALRDCSARPLWWAPAEAKCPLTLSVVERPDGLACLWEYSDDHFSAAETEAMAALFLRGLDLLAEGGTATPAELVAPYRRTLPEPGRGASVPPGWTTVAEGFARQVALTPDAPALATDDGTTVGYAALDAYAAALAAELRAVQGPAADDGLPRCVVLHLGPSVEHVVALLALARLNLTIVPLDPAYPPALLRQFLEQLDPLCVLLPPGGEHGFDQVDPDGRIVRHPVILSTAAAPALPPHDGVRPLYTLFTSGSTGTPKGVQVSDRTLCNLLLWQTDSGGLAAPADTQQFSMLSFDVSFQEVFGTLCGGGCLHLVRPQWRQDAPALLEQLESSGVQRVFMPYVALQLLAEHGVHLGRFPTRLREVVTAGEQLVCTDAIRRWFAGMPGARLFNHYGPTETHVVSSLCLDGDPMRWPDRPAIGRPVANAVLRVVDGDGQAVPAECTGELLLGGTMATRCYLGNPALHDERFVELPGLGLFYRSGDRARFDREGLLHYCGRDDQQIKLSGHRLELGQVEAALLRHPRILNAVVVRDGEQLDGEQLVACLQLRDGAPAAEGPAAEELAAHLAPLLPPYVRIERFRVLDALPRTPSGKLDRRGALRAPGRELRRLTRTAQPDRPQLSALEARLAREFETVTGSPVGPEQTFFEAGASSLGLMRFQLRCTAGLGLRFTIADLFEHVTVRALARFLDGQDTATTSPDPGRADANGSGRPDEPIAVIGMAVRLPGAVDLPAFWELVRTGGRGMEHFDAPDPLVGVRSQMDGLLAFDPDHFGISRQEALLMDPQQRHLLMSCVEALAHAGIADPSASRVGLVAGAGENTYFQAMLRGADPARLPDGFQLALHHEKDFLTTKAAYHLGLTGPAFTTQAACASSLLAVHVAAGLLRQGDAEVMLAGGVLVDTELTDGYHYRPQHIFSVDGHCRPFSDDASGTVGASGVGMVVLKPLRLARRDGDTVYSVITGSAVNNDGSDKLSYSAPSLAGQREVIRAALRRSGRTGADLGYVEAHGTGTRLGDPVEVGALRQAFAVTEPDRCALTSVKSQIGHLGAAAGVVGLVRATLAVHHGLIPPNVDFHALNPQIGPDPTPFYIPSTARPWPEGRERVAAVSSFGIGGTNAHLVIESDQAQVPAAGPVPHTPSTAPAAAVVQPCLVLSGSSEAALRTDAARIADYLEGRPESYPQVLRHLQAGRPPRRLRIAAACPDAPSAVAWLRGATVSATPVPVPATGGPGVPAVSRPATDLAGDWLAGRAIAWPTGPAQAPWDFPPPAFALADYDFDRAPRPADTLEAPRTAGAGTAAGSAGFEAPPRLPEADWLHQPQWVRRHRAAATAPTAGPSRTGRLLVLMTDGQAPSAAVRTFDAVYDRVVRVEAADTFARHGDDLFEVDPADAVSLRLLLDSLADAGPDGIDWLHALPLGVDGPVGPDSLERARRACLDTAAALVQAAAGAPWAARLRPWWLSYRARPVDGRLLRPELGLLAGAGEVVPQESPVRGHWIDLPHADPSRWAPQLATLLAQARPGSDTSAGLPRQLALRQGFWWEQVALPVAPGGIAPLALPAGPGVHLVLGGTGGIGAALASWLLAETDSRVLLLGRQPQPPQELAPWADRVELIAADLAEEPLHEVLSRIAGRTARIDSVVHAVGLAAGGLIVRRDTATARAGTEAKLRGALLVERLIERYRPTLAVYCSSMSAQLGGVGQFDYAAANGLLDGFAGHRTDDAETTARISIAWDVWAETGMAVRVIQPDARHRAHLAVGLSVEEGKRLFARAVGLRLPQVLVSTTDVDASRAFYAGAITTAAPAPAPTTTPATATEPAPSSATPAGILSERLCAWLGVDGFDPDLSLYDLGADSLTMLDLIEEVKRRFDVELELSQLSHRVSLSEILDRLRQATAASDVLGAGEVTVEVWQQGTGNQVLCLVHPVGGDIQAYRSLVSALDARLTVCLIADPALRQPGTSAWTLAERARRYHAALQARFPHGTWRRQVAGWSFGAWVAVGMAAEAEAAGRPLDALHLLDPPPPGAGALLRRYDESQLATVFANELGHSGTGSAGPQAQAYAERLAECCRANLRSMTDHQVPRLAATPSQLWLAGQPVDGLPSYGTPERQQALWRGHLPEPSDWHRLDTTHYGIVRPPYADAVAAAINAASQHPSRNR
ncbi:amino acid adenylation domain-containing protein [Streptacidiphilus sp. EB129]|uniref:amino acid adenylation domain-containing protein n=1 Tax=Streptacidiphilus sp. EB129 TaxID=3156262 RepID=UPI003519461E